MNGTNGVSVSKVAQIMDLYNFLPDMDLKKPSGVAAEWVL